MKSKRRPKGQKPMRMPQERELKSLLNLPRKLTAEFQGQIFTEVNGENFRFKILPAFEADERSRVVVGNKTPGRGRPRILVQCNSCMKWVGFSRYNQHNKIHEAVQS